MICVASSRFLILVLLVTDRGDIFFKVGTDLLNNLVCRVVIIEM